MLPSADPSLLPPHPRLVHIPLRLSVKTLDANFNRFVDKRRGATIVAVKVFDKIHVGSSGDQIQEYGSVTPASS